MQKNQNYKYNEKYIGIILSAGKSTRLKKNLKITSKNLVKIKKGKDSLEYNLQKLEKAEITNIYINTHQYHKKFISRIKNRFSKSNKISLINEKKILGTAGGVFNICKKFPNFENVIVLYGDNISNINLKRVIKIYENKNSKFSIVVHKLNDFKSSGVVKFNKNNEITSFNEKLNIVAKKYNWVNAGIYIINKNIIENFKVSNCDFAKDIIPFLLKKNKNKIYAIKTTMRVFAIDDVDLLNKTKREINF